MQLLISEEYAEKIVPSNDSVRLLDEIIEEMRLEPLERAYKRTGRNYGTRLRTMLKIFDRASVADSAVYTLYIVF